MSEGLRSPRKQVQCAGLVLAQKGSNNMHTTVTFDQMERRAERTLGVALWAKHVKNVAEGTVLFAGLHTLLRSLVRSLSKDEKLNSLSDKELVELTASLTELHDHLASMLD